MITTRKQAEQMWSKQRPNERDNYEKREREENTTSERAKQRRKQMQVASNKQSVHSTFVHRSEEANQKNENAETKNQGAHPPSTS
jgi:hypothetical protein